MVFKRKVFLGRSSLLAELNVATKTALTPKAKHLFERAKQYRKRVMRAKRIHTSLKRKLFGGGLTEPEMLNKIGSSMNLIQKRFFLSQLENMKRKGKGRRYSLEDKILAIALYRQSGVGYRFLSQFFALPSRKTITNLLGRIPIKPGLHEEVLSILKTEAKNFKNEQDKYCLLMFDEMAVQPSLQVNTKEGSVEGFENFGKRKSEKIANHAQVCMLRGIRRKWKQPIFYNFANGGTKKFELVSIIKEIIRKCHSIGIHVLATVCDQGSNNQAAINILVQETREKCRQAGQNMEGYYFEIDGWAVIPLYDVPHLFKGLRNNWLKYDIQYMENGTEKVGKWKHIFDAYRMDPYIGNLRLMPKITDGHVNPQNIDKMKVSKCTQVLSRTVAAAVNVFAFTGN